MRIAILALLAPLLAGCVTTGSGSVKGGECRIFERPEYAVRGKVQYDQDWIDGNIEAGVGGCGWKRPKARPAAFDVPKGHAIIRSVPVKKRSSLLKRIKDRAVYPFSTPVAPIVQSPPVVDRWEPVVEPSPSTQSPSAPRDPVDELLHPSDR